MSHILVDTEEQAKSIKAQLDKGGDFAALAKAESKDNQGATGGSAQQGGSLGCLTAPDAAQLVPEFQAGYKDLAIGTVSAPVKTSFGFHLIKVTERKQRSLEEATTEIGQRLGQETQDKFNDLITGVARKAKVKVNPRYGKFDAAQLAIVPPDAPPSANTRHRSGT